MTSPVSQRWRTVRWIGAAAIVVVAVAVLTVWLTEPRPGGPMDPSSTSSDGAHALVALLRDQGVEVEVADTAADAARLARADSLLLVAQTYYLYDSALLDQLAKAPGDLLLVEPTSQTREALAPAVRTTDKGSVGGEPKCDLREANRAGSVWFGPSNTYQVSPAGSDATSCYDGALVRYRDAHRTITVVGTSEFLTNSTLLRDGNAALAMNLAGAKPRLVWYAPQHSEGQHHGAASIFDLIPDRVGWIVWQLGLVVALVALWKGRRLGPLVAERLPVVVRASETVEGRGRLYRSRRARDRAADALRTATLQRLTPRLGLGTNTEPAAIVGAVSARQGGDPMTVQHTLFGPPPATDADLVHLAHALDDIERQVAHS